MADEYGVLSNLTMDVGDTQEIDLENLVETDSVEITSSDESVTVDYDASVQTLTVYANFAGQATIRVTGPVGTDTFTVRVNSTQQIIVNDADRQTGLIQVRHRESVGIRASTFFPGARPRQVTVDVSTAHTGRVSVATGGGYITFTGTVVGGGLVTMSYGGETKQATVEVKAGGQDADGLRLPWESLTEIIEIPASGRYVLDLDRYKPLGVNEDDRDDLTYEIAAQSQTGQLFTVALNGSALTIRARGPAGRGTVDIVADYQSVEDSRAQIPIYIRDIFGEQPAPFYPNEDRYIPVSEVELRANANADLTGLEPFSLFEDGEYEVIAEIDAIMGEVNVAGVNLLIAFVSPHAGISVEPRSFRDDADFVLPVPRNNEEIILSFPNETEGQE